MEELRWLLKAIQQEDVLTIEKHKSPGVGHYSPNPPRDFQGKEVWHGIRTDFSLNPDHPRLDHIGKLMNLLQEEGSLIIFNSWGTCGYHFELNEKRFTSLVKKLHLNEGKRVPSFDKKLIHYSPEPCGLSCIKSGELYVFKNENSFTTMLMRAIFSGDTLIGEWLDCGSEGVGDAFKDKKLYHTARGINKSFRLKFGIKDDIFNTDYPNNRVRINNKSDLFDLD